MTPTANTREAIRALIGRKVVGVLFDALPAARADLSKGTKTLVFEDGSGFTFNSNGAFWFESADEVSRAVRIAEKDLRATQQDLRGVLELAGVLTGVQQSGRVTE